MPRGALHSTLGKWDGRMESRGPPFEERIHLLGQQIVTTKPGLHSAWDDSEGRQPRCDPDMQVRITAFGGSEVVGQQMDSDCPDSVYYTCEV